jgi:hypothetical protein
MVCSAFIIKECMKKEGGDEGLSSRSPSMPVCSRSRVRV